MNLYEIKQKAIETEEGENNPNLKFQMTRPDGVSFNGYFVDSYRGIIKVPEISEERNFTLNDLFKQAGHDYFDFRVID